MTKPSLIAVFSLFICWASFAGAAQRPPAAAIASAHPLATDAGFEILNAGGNAFDAAVAISAALAVVEPSGSGLGGGGFWLLHRAEDNREVMIDGRERAPLAATATMYLDANGEPVPRLSLDGALAAGIPGTPAALVHLAREYGKLPLARSLEPAIRLARDGFAIDEHYRAMIGFRITALRASPAAAAIFLHDGEVPTVGDVVRQTDLANVLEAIVHEGRAGFYAGEVADALIAGVRTAGGIWSKDDLADYKVIEREPVHGMYRGIRITSAPPPSSGGIALVTMLNVLSGYELDKLDPITQRHLIVEAMRRAYRDRAIYLGDPDFVTIPSELTEPAYASGLRSAIRTDRAMPSALLPGLPAEVTGTDTTHFSVLDEAGNRVAATLSVNLPFGAGFVPPGTGVLLNNEMDDFSTKPGAPNAYGLIGSAIDGGTQANAIAPGKRPLSSMTPTFLDDGKRVAILGTPGGSRIISMVLLASLEFARGGKPADWVSAGRYHHQFFPDRITYEPDALTAEEIAGLKKLGHTLQVSDRRYGNMQIVLWNRETNTVDAASDPRGGGGAETRATAR
ncbi:MAG: gamma-glutamyltransferase [Chromatiales bacterium]|nr:gamma-glutamyltransferase [Chromatiales bacterium]